MLPPASGERGHEAELSLAASRWLGSGESCLQQIYHTCTFSFLTFDVCLQVHVYCKQLSQPILSHTLKPQMLPPSMSYFTLATTWKPNSAHLLVAASTGSVHVLAMQDGSLS